MSDCVAFVFVAANSKINFPKRQMRAILLVLPVARALYINLTAHLTATDNSGTFRNSSSIFTDEQKAELLKNEADNIVHAQVFNQIIEKVALVATTAQLAMEEIVEDPLDFAIEADRSLDRRIGAFEDKIEDMKDRVREKKEATARSTKNLVFHPIQVVADATRDEDNDFDLEDYVQGNKYNEQHDSTGYRVGI